MRRTAALLAIAVLMTPPAMSAEMPNREDLALPEGTYCVSSASGVVGESRSGSVYSLRAVLLHTGWEHIGHKLYVQWIERLRDESDVVRASLLVEDSFYPSRCPRLERLADGTVRLMLERIYPDESDLYGDGEWTSVLVLLAKEPGVIKVLSDRRKPPSKASPVP